MVRGLYAIVDLPLPVSVPLPAFCEALVAGGAQTVQVRSKQLDDRLFAEAVRVVAEFAGAARVVVNDRIDVARALGLWVHLGQEDWAALGPAELGDVPFGLSTHSVAQVEQAAAAAQYLGFGPIYETNTKPDTEATVGLGRLREVSEITARPVVAIGGITPERAKDCVRAGASAIACISGLLAPTARGVEERAAAYARAFDA